MKWAFWAAAGMVAYTYVGYPCLLWVRALWWPRPVKRAACQPWVSIVMVVRNEEKILEKKLRNLLALDYPADRYRIVVVSDGSTDGTEVILREFRHEPRLCVGVNATPRGKACCINDALDLAQEEIIVFTDARQTLEPDALALLAENFADPEVGCVSGQLMLGDPGSREVPERTGLYWKLEKRIRELESTSSSTVGATGAFYAVRRSLVTAVPAGTILDDVYIPMNVVRQGTRVVFDARALAWDLPYLGTEREFGRKVRTLTGNYQLVQIEPWLLTIRNPLLFEFISHKLLRLLVPFAMAVVLVCAVFLSAPVYRFALVCQIVLYGLGALGSIPLRQGRLKRITDAPFTFIMLNTAAVCAFLNFVSGRKALWTR